MWIKAFLNIQSHFFYPFRLRVLLEKKKDVLCVSGMSCQCISGGLCLISHSAAGFFLGSLSVLIASEEAGMGLGERENCLNITTSSSDISEKHSHAA